MITRRGCGDAVRTRGDFVADRGAEGDMPFAAARARRTRWAWAAACSRARGRRRCAWADILAGYDARRRREGTTRRRREGRALRARRRADGVEPGGGKAAPKADGCRRDSRLRTELAHEQLTRRVCPYLRREQLTGRPERSACWIPSVLQGASPSRIHRSLPQFAGRQAPLRSTASAVFER